MAVSRIYIEKLRLSRDEHMQTVYQALSSIADGIDQVHSAIGIQPVPGSGSGTAHPAPAPVQFSVTAGNGHFIVTVTNPTVSGIQVPLQHELQSAKDTNFNANSSVTTYTLGVNQLSLDVVDPGVTKYWRIRSRYQGSGWNQWQFYSNSSGIVSLSSGTLKTS